MIAPAAVGNGKETSMMLKSPFYRAAILLPLFLSFAGQFLGVPPGVSAVVAPSSPSVQVIPTPPAIQQVHQATREHESRAQADSQNSQEGPSQTISPEQQRKFRFEKMKRDVDELADLIKALQEEVNKSNENVLSRGIVDKADKIGKLAKKIKGSARGS
jgi:uncharacterized FlaG/YvyC family protein